jgi:predicted nucleic acid-binding protein
VIENDPDDGHAIACAVAARADLIVSGDRQALAVQHEDIHIVSPAEALATITAR